MATHARTEFAAALNQLASEKGIDVSVVVEAIEQAALAAYRKDLSLRGEEIPEDFEELTAKIDPITGEIFIYRGKENITPPGFARIAAQTAKQVIMQRLHEAEKGAISDEYEKKVGTVMSGMIQRLEGNTYFVDLGRAEGVMPFPEQVRDEFYRVSQRLKVYVKEIREGRRGPEVVVSRFDANLVKGLFALEVPEIQTGAVVIKDIAREAGNRTKIAAISTQEGVDPVGSLVGQKGVRVQAVMNELGEEKIDIISYSDDPARFIAAALSPAKEVQVTISDKENKIAKVKVPSTQLSLAIGKGGQNVRLAAKLTGWKIDIEGTETPEAREEARLALEAAQKEDKEAVAEGVEEEIDKAMAEESIDGTVVEEPSAEEAGVAFVAAEEDIAKDESAIEPERPSEEEAPTVANTSETPNVSSEEETFPGEGEKEANEERIAEDQEKTGPDSSYVQEESEENKSDKS